MITITPSTNPTTAAANHCFSWTHYSRKISFGLICCLLLLQGCAGVNTFPTVARAGDTISLMIGGSETATKENVGVSLFDANGTQFKLRGLGYVRSVFNLRADGRAVGTHYSGYLNSSASWNKGHEPIQTVMVVDIPLGAAPGPATIEITLGQADDSSGTSIPLSLAIEIISGTGSPDSFLRNLSGNPVPASFDLLEPAPHAKIVFDSAATEKIGAVSLVVDFDETILNPDDINIYVPESNVRGNVVDPGAFGATQRMVYWHQDGLQLFIDIVAPQGIAAEYLQLFLMHPTGLSGDPLLSLGSATVYDVDGNEIILSSSLTYTP